MNIEIVKDIAMAAIIKKLQEDAFKQKLAGWAIVAIVAYLLLVR